MTESVFTMATELKVLVCWRNWPATSSESMEVVALQQGAQPAAPGQLSLGRAQHGLGGGGELGGIDPVCLQGAVDEQLSLCLIDGVKAVAKGSQHADDGQRKDEAMQIKPQQPVRVHERNGSLSWRQGSAAILRFIAGSGKGLDRKQYSVKSLNYAKLYTTTIILLFTFQCIILHIASLLARLYRHFAKSFLPAITPCLPLSLPADSAIVAMPATSPYQMPHPPGLSGVPI